MFPERHIPGSNGECHSHLSEGELGRIINIAFSSTFPGKSKKERQEEEEEVGGGQRGEKAAELTRIKRRAAGGVINLHGVHSQHSGIQSGPIGRRYSAEPPQYIKAVYKVMS